MHGNYKSSSLNVYHFNWFLETRIFWMFSELNGLAQRGLTSMVVCVSRDFCPLFHSKRTWLQANISELIDCVKSILFLILKPMTMPQTKEERERLSRERDKIKFFHARFENRQVEGLWEGGRR